MAGVWRLYSHRRKNGHSYLSHTEIFYLPLIPHFGISDYILSYSCFLDEYKKLYQKFKKKSCAIPLIGLRWFRTN